MRINLKRALALCTVVLMAAVMITGCAKADANTNIEGRVAELERQISNMETRVETLEKSQPIVGGTVEKKAEESYSVADVSNIFIDVVFADTKIIASTDDTIKVISYSNLKSDTGDVSFSLKDGEIKIYQERNNNMGWNGFNNMKSNIEIYLPAGYKGDMFLDSTSGDLKADNLSIKNLKVDATSGDVEVSRLTVDKLTVDSTSGDVNIDVFSGTAMIDLTSGDAKIGVAAIGDYIEIDTTSGDVELAVNEKLGIDISLRCASGSISTYFGDSSGLKTKNISKQLGSAPYKSVKASTTSGDISVTKADF